MAMASASIIEQSHSHPHSSRKQDHHRHQHNNHHEATAASDSFNLREWGLKARTISRDNTSSRRFSASNIRNSFRELESSRSFRSNFTISSTASSPGYPLLRDEIDPSTYSFTIALKALQARNVWECLSPDGFALNSKWNEAEKYICNPLSGEFPMECLSAKTLSGRSFRNPTNTLTMSAPLVFSSSTSHYHSRNIIQQSYNNKPSSGVAASQEHDHHFPVSGKKTESMSNSSSRDVGTQSAPNNLSSGSTSPPSCASTPSIVEASLKRCDEAAEAGEEDFANSNAKPKPELEVEVKETRGNEETERDNDDDNNKGDQKQKSCLYSRSSRQAAGCLSWMRKRQRDKHKPRKKHHFFPHLRRC